MIPTLDEMVRGVVGAALLLRNDGRAMGAFDVTWQGFVKSFFAALLVLPAFVVVHWLQTRDVPFEPTPMPLAVVAYALQWAAFPLTAAALAKLMRRGEQFVPYVIAANWASVVQIGIVLAVVLIGTVLPMQLTGFVLLAMTMGLLLYDYLIAKLAFDAEGLEGVGVVMVQLLVGMLIQRLVAG